MARLSRSTICAAGLAALIVLAGAVAVVLALPLREWLSLVGAALRSQGPVGVVLFWLLCVAAAMALTPAAILCVVAGLIYGLGGLPLAWLAMMGAAAGSLLLSRHFLAARVAALARRQRHLGAVADVVDEEGWRMVLLVRISGVLPFGVQNYLFGVTRIGLGPYLAATAFGILPVIVVYGGAGALGAAAIEEGGPPEALRLAVLALAAVAALALIGLTIRKVRAKLAVPRP